MSTQTDTTSSDHWRMPGCPQPPGWTLEFDALVARFAWLRDMADCPQDPEWHAEGDVLTHVGMVCAALAELPAWRRLPKPQRHVVFAATLLHDVAKPRFTKMEEGRIRSRGHTIGGAKIARRILYEGAGDDLPPPPVGVREGIVGLVRHHGLPATFLEKRDLEHAVIAASLTTRLDLLAILAEADMRGRVCAGQDDAVDRTVLFGEYAAELGCAAAPYRFASDHSRFCYFQRPGGPPTIQVYDATRSQVTLMSGLPGAGKDTWIHLHAGKQAVVSLDELRAEFDVNPADDQGGIAAEAKERAKALLRRSEPFIWNATNTTRFLRDGLIRLFAAYNAHVRIVYCEAPLPLVRERNGRRTTPVPERVIDRLLDGLEVPDLTEAHEVEYVVADK